MSLSLKNNQVGNQLIGCQARRRRIFLYLLVLVRLGNSDFRGFWVSKSKKNRLLKSGYSAPNLLKSRYSRFEAIAQVGGSMFFGDWLKSKNHRKFLRLKPYECTLQYSTNSCL